MRCKTVRKNMFLYFENKLKAKKREKINEHLKGCAWCMSEYKKGEHILNVMRGSNPKELPEGLHKNIMQEIHGLKSYDEERKKEVKFMFGLATRRMGLALASFLTVCVLIVAVPFEVIKDKGLEGINYIAEYIESKETENKAFEAQDESIVSDLEVLKDTTQDSLITENEKINSGSATQTANNEALKMFDNVDIKEKVEVEETNMSFSENQVKNDTIEEVELVYNGDVIYVADSKLQLKTAELTNTIEDINNYIKEYNGKIISKEITYRNDNYRSASLDIDVKYSNLQLFKEKLNSKHKIEKDVETTIDNTKLVESEKQLLKELNDETEKLRKDLEKISDTEQKNIINENITNVQGAIAQLENKLNSEDMKYAKVNVTIEEVDEFELEGVISSKNFFKGLGKKFNIGVNNFIRILQNALLWISENLLAIVFYTLSFIIIYNIFKVIISSFRE